MNKYEVWMEGFIISGQEGKAHRVVSEQGKTLWEGETFKDAVKQAVQEAIKDKQYYDPERNTYWGCRFFDNEAEARKSFG
jgi:hypothetical protein